MGCKVLFLIIKFISKLRFNRNIMGCKDEYSEFNFKRYIDLIGT